MTARMPASLTAAAISSAKKYWSQKVVVPESSISAADSATAGPISDSTSDSSGSRMELYQPSMVRRLCPSDRPRNSTIAECVWAFTRPGMTRCRVRSTTSSYPDGSGVVAFGPTPLILPSRTAIQPSSNVRFSVSTVRIVPPWKSVEPI